VEFPLLLYFAGMALAASTFCDLEVPPEPASKRPDEDLEVRTTAVRKDEYPGPLFPFGYTKRVEAHKEPKVYRVSRWYDAEGHVYRWWTVDLALERNPYSAEWYRDFHFHVNDGALPAVWGLAVGGPVIVDSSYDDREGERLTEHAAFARVVCAYNNWVAQPEPNEEVIGAPVERSGPPAGARRVASMVLEEIGENRDPTDTEVELVWSYITDQGMSGTDLIEVAREGKARVGESASLAEILETGRAAEVP
jgi:hypothetical protein